MKKTRWLIPLLLITAIFISACSISIPFLNRDNRDSSNAPSAPQAQVEPSRPAEQDQPEALMVEPVQPLNADQTVLALQNVLTKIHDEVSPSVVNLRVISRPSVGQVMPQLPFELPNIPGLPLNPQNPDDQQPENAPQQGSLGSGFVWDDQGHIVTNNHVVADAEKITVTFTDGTIRNAVVIGTDPDSDLAVIKLDSLPDRLTPVVLGDSTALKVGNLVVAIGSPFGLENTSTVGFISALGRSLPVENGSGGSNYTIPDVIQTDAPINPGNSGGVLVNDRGEVIGVPTAIESPIRANAGIGFAVPASIVKNVVPELIEKGKYTHAWLGVSGTSLVPDLAKAMGLDEDTRGALVIQVVENSPAEKGGVKGSTETVEIDGQQARVGGDIITSVNGEKVINFDDVAAYVGARARVGDTLTLEVLRDGKSEQLEVTLAARPNQESASRQPTQQAPAAANAWLGIAGRTVTDSIREAMKLDNSVEGVLVGEVTPNSPADKAGLRPSKDEVQQNGETLRVGGDIITAIDSSPIQTIEDLRSTLAKMESGDVIEITILRNGEEQKLDITLAERPANLN